MTVKLVERSLALHAKGEWSATSTLITKMHNHILNLPSFYANTYRISQETQKQAHIKYEVQHTAEPEPITVVEVEGQVESEHGTEANSNGQAEPEHGTEVNVDSQPEVSLPSVSFISQFFSRYLRCLLCPTFGRYCQRRILTVANPHVTAHIAFLPLRILLCFIIGKHRWTMAINR